MDDDETTSHASYQSPVAQGEAPAAGQRHHLETPPSIVLKRSSKVIARRHSAHGPVLPIQEGTTEGLAEASAPVTRLLRRSSTQRGLPHLARSLSPKLTGLNRTGSAGKVQAMDTTGDDSITSMVVEKETPYEEMVIRFQIRQLQRTPSQQSDGKRMLIPSSKGVDGRASAFASWTDLVAPPRRSSSNSTVDLQPPDHAPPESQVLDDFEFVYEQTRRDTFYAWKSRLTTPISPFSSFSQARYLVVAATTALYLVLFPLGFAFPTEKAVFRLDVPVGMLLALDMTITLHTSFVTKTGVVVDSHRAIAWRYVTSSFLFDAVLAILIIVRACTAKVNGAWLHTALGLLSAERLARGVSTVRVVWLTCLSQSGSRHGFWAWLSYSRYSLLLRVIGVVVGVIVIVHYIACIWTALLDDLGELHASTWSELYSTNFYAGLLLLQGQGLTTDTASQSLFASLSSLLGSIVLALVFGHVAMLVSNFNSSATDYRDKMEAVVAMTAKLQLPLPLRERIHKYYEHLWHEYERLDGEIIQFSKELSHTLELEVVLFKYMQLVMCVSFWQECSPNFQKQLMLCLDVRVYLPEDFIMRQGEIDDTFYMVNRGYCELSCEAHQFENVTGTVLSGLAGNTHFGGINTGHRQSAYELDATQRQYYRNGGRQNAQGRLSLITRGQAFGDLALLMNYPRATNVRAITHVEMCVLSRDSFQSLLAKYPNDRQRVVVNMLTSYMENYLENQHRCPLLEMVRNVYSPTAIAEACSRLGRTPPLLPQSLTPRQAAERVYLAINVEMKDPTLKFGIGGDVREQLIEMRERWRHQREQPEIVENNSNQHHQTASSEFTGDSTSKSMCSDSPRVPSDHHQDDPQTKQMLSWQERLRQVEEHEVAILQVVKELHGSFKLLQAQRATIEPSEAPQGTRKRPAPDADTPNTPISATIGARPRLLQRMGSLVGLTSAVSQDSQDQPVSPTHYADQLFRTHATTSASHLPSIQLKQQRRPQQLHKAASTTKLFQEKITTTEPDTIVFYPKTGSAASASRGFPAQAQSLNAVACGVGTRIRRVVTESIFSKSTVPNTKSSSERSSGIPDEVC